MATPSWRQVIPLLASVVLLLLAPLAWAGYLYDEEFTTTVYMDAGNTTADWNTTAGQLGLFPFEPTLAGSCDTPDRSFGLAIAGDYVYVADALSGLQVIDVTDLANPVLVGSLATSDCAYDVVVAGDYAFVADRFSGLTVIDITDPTDPTLAGSCATSDLAGGIDLAGDYAFVADRMAGLTVIDISDPTDPSIAGSYNTPGEAVSVRIAGNYAYVGDATPGLQVIDISDPTSPSLAGSYNTPGAALGVALAGDRAYVADRLSGLRVVDISDPANPVSVGSCDTPDYARGVAVSGDRAYVADGESGLQVIDISDPTNPVSTESYDTPDWAAGVVVEGEYAYVADYAGLHVVRIIQTTAPTVAATWDSPGEARDAVVEGDYAYVVDAGSGLQVVDISDPTSPALAGSQDTPGTGYAVAISGDYAYVADGAPGLQVIDISDPTDPVIAGSYDTPDWAYSVTVAGDYAYVPDRFTGLVVLDISDPSTPTAAGTYNTSNEAVAVAIAGDYAYVGDAVSGLQVVNISDPTSPVLAGSCNTPGEALGVAIAGDYAYVADKDAGLQVIDISDPANPVIAGNYNTPDYARGVSVVGDYAYVGDGLSGLQVIDISDPTTPVLGWSCDTADWAWDVAIAGEYAYVPDSDAGLQVIRILERGYDTDSNVAQSLPIDAGSDVITRAHLVTSQADSIRWDLSADGGASWEEVHPTQAWHTFASPGTDLLWRSTHAYTGGGINPACTDLAIVWEYNVVCDPDPLTLNIAAGSASIDVDYLGGGGGLLYGYSLEFSWDGSIATTTPGQVTEGSLLSDAGTTQFLAYASGTDEITVDCSLLSAPDGVTGPGTMFTIEFDAVASGVTPVEVTVTEGYDNNRQLLSGFFAEDGEVQVDVDAPVISDVGIENLTLGHTDAYIKNTDAAKVTATVTDVGPGTFDATNIEANLLGLGGGDDVNPSPYAGGAAEWTLTLTSVTCSPPDGTVTVYVDATDSFGNPAVQGSATITSDNIAPTKITGFAASPGHNKAELSWDDPAATDTNPYQVMVRSHAWGDYPTYGVGMTPSYPSDELDGTFVWEGAGASHTALYASDGSERDTYYYGAFASDMVLHYGPADATAQDRSTNYWLGDVVEDASWGTYDGLVTMYDIDKLAGTYAASGPGSPWNQCDVGPTDDMSRVGIPVPDALVDFEDAMIVAMNFGVVAPKALPSKEPRDEAVPLALILKERSTAPDLGIAVHLQGNNDLVKGLSAVVGYDAAELEFVSARLSDRLAFDPTPEFFWYHSDGSSVQVDLAVLGTGLTIEGSGDVVVLSFHALDDEYTLGFESVVLRGANNEPLEGDVGGLEAKPELPETFHLAGVVPNPFNPVTKIRYHVPRESEVMLRIYDVSGREVLTLLDRVVAAGRHEAVWNGRDATGEAVGSGVYFCVMEAPGFHDERKMTLLK